MTRLTPEMQKTATFGGVAIFLVLLTWVTEPRVRTPEVFAERGAVLFPEFKDPNAAASLEVIEFDAQSATVRPFKVQNRNGRWTIPSQFDYPTDAKDRLSQTAAGIIALRTDDFASDNISDHERMGVLDPLDTTLPTLMGRGARLTVRGAQEQVLADVIVGNQVEGRPGFRYIRQPSQRRVYISNTGNLQLSSAFADWIDRDLLQVAPLDIDAINLRNYSLDRTTGQVDPGETMLLTRTGTDWTINGLGGNQELNLDSVDLLLRNLAGLRIEGVLPKPAGISGALAVASGSATLNDADVADLRRKGFYLTPTGQLVSNRGEIVVRTVTGLFYTLRFGDIAPGTEAPSTGAAQGSNAQGDAQADDAPRENRYMFIMVDHSPSDANTPSLAADGAEKAKTLRARFAPWYYIISADASEALQMSRQDLVQPRSAN
jgi:hypothetical protein